jgi:hypothetical protein
LSHKNSTPLVKQQNRLKRNQEIGAILEDITENCLKRRGVSYERNKQTGKGPDFKIRPKYRGREAIAYLENKHWSDHYWVTPSHMKKQVTPRFPKGKKANNQRHVIMSTNKISPRAREMARREGVEVHSIGKQAIDANDVDVNRQVDAAIGQIIVSILLLLAFQYYQALSRLKREVMWVQVAEESKTYPTEGTGPPNGPHLKCESASESHAREPEGCAESNITVGAHGGSHPLWLVQR